MMPTPLLNAYSRELSILTAEESLILAERMAVGAGRLKRGVAQRIADGWRRQARSRAAVLRPRNATEHRAYASLAGLPVKYTRVEKPSDG